jgi:DNA mismatch repair protein MutL
VDESTDILTIKGFIGKPEWARKTRGEQFFFANNRFIKNAYLHHAVASAYEELLQPDSHPFYTIFLELDPSKIDINVHPTKTEIKFVDEKVIYAMLRAAVRKSLSQYHIAPSLNFEEEMSMRVPEPMQNRPFRDEESSSGTWMSNISSSPLQRNRSKPEDWLELYKSLDQKIAQAQQQEEDEEDNMGEGTASANEELLEIEESAQKPVMQLHQKYIITSIRSGLMVIHQQWAHERILFEKYLDTLDNAKGFSQRLLFPEVIQLQPADFVLVKEILPGISSLGFELEEFGKNAFVMNGIPAGIPSQSQQNILEKILEDYKNTAQGQKLEKNEKLARALAKNTAIKVGRVLAYEEMTQLIDELFACKMPYYSPDGRPALVTMSSEELDKKFKN